MLVLKRKEGQWVDITHRSGEVIRIRVCDISPGQLNLAFDDDARNFQVERPERRKREPAEANRPPGPDSWGNPVASTAQIEDMILEIKRMQRNVTLAALLPTDGTDG
jgi:hypothetical protein